MKCPRKIHKCGSSLAQAISGRRLIGHIKKNETAKARRLMCGGQANGAIVSVFEHWQNADVGVKLHSVWREALGIRISTRERKSSRQRRCRKGRWVDVSLVLVLLHMHGTFFQMPFYTQCPIGHKKKKKAMMAHVQAQGAGNCWGSRGLAGLSPEATGMYAHAYMEHLTCVWPTNQPSQTSH